MAIFLRLCCQLQFAGGNFEVAFLHFLSVTWVSLAAVAEAEPLAGSVMVHRYFADLFLGFCQIDGNVHFLNSKRMAIHCLPGSNILFIP